MILFDHPIIQRGIKQKRQTENSKYCEWVSINDEREINR
jgi:hypothetical protein